MHQQPPHPPFFPNSSTRSDQRAGVSGRIATEAPAGTFAVPLLDMAAFWHGERGTRSCIVMRP